MNNEPVAWMIIDVDNGKSLQFEENKFSEINIPLYTAPKKLSDEEIGNCVDDYFGLIALQHKYIYDIDQVQEYGLKLARAIEERHGIK